MAEEGNMQERRLSIDENGQVVGGLPHFPIGKITNMTLGSGFPPSGGINISTLPHIVPAPTYEPVVKKEIVPAFKFLQDAMKQMEARGALRDKPQGERSMAAIVKTFNALTGKDLTEAEGWEFMVILKMVRGRQGKFNDDDYTDGSAYFGLLGECESGRDR